MKKTAANEKHQIQLLTLLDEAYLDSRYPEDVVQFEEEFDVEKCKKYFQEVTEVFKCLKNLMTKS